jgi:hypothetical protein
MVELGIPILAAQLTGYLVLGNHTNRPWKQPGNNPFMPNLIDIFVSLYLYGLSRFSVPLHLRPHRTRLYGDHFVNVGTRQRPGEAARERLLCGTLVSQVCGACLRCLARDLRRTGARGLAPTGIRLSKSSVISIACGMLNSNIRSKSIEPAARSVFPMS